MGWGEVPVPPNVTMGCGNSSTIDPVGASRTFTASVNQAANIVVTFILADSGLNSVTVLSRSVTASEVVTFTIDTSNIGEIAPSALKGTNTIRVVATNSSGTGTGTCSWTLTYPAPTVSMECPGSSVYGAPPTFTASTDYSATITINVLDDTEEVVATYSETGSTISFTPEGIDPGTYAVCAVATNEYGTSNTICCSWIVEDLEITLSCPGSTTYGVHPSFYTTINAPSTVTFYLDGNPIIPSWSGTQGVTYTPSTDVAVGTHVVSVHAVCGGEEASAECAWIVLSEPLTVSLSCPEGPDPVGIVKQFSATTNLPAKITFFVNGASKSYENVTNASIDVAQLNGGLTISVSAEALGMADAQSCIWGALPLPEPLVITSIDPSVGNIEDTMGTIRTFRATVNQPASISFYFDGLLVESSPINVTEWSYTSNPLPPGSHFVKVIAQNKNGYVEYYWNWHSNLVIIYSIDGQCANPASNCGLSVNACYNEIRYPEQSSEIVIECSVLACLQSSSDSGFLLYSSSTSLHISVSWPGGSIERDLEYGSGSINEKIGFSVPKVDYYNITCTAGTVCNGIQFAKQDDPNGQIYPCIPLPMTYFGDASCSIRLPEQGNTP